MADKKISQLPAATLPLAGTELLPIVQSGTTDNITVNNLAAGNLKSNSTTGVLQVTGPAAASTRVMTTPDANFTAARTDAGQTFTGNQQINGALGVGVAASSAKLQVQDTVNSSVETSVTNLSTGSQASAGIAVKADSTATGLFRTYGTGVTGVSVFGQTLANYTGLFSDGASSNGMLIGSLTSDPIIFGTNNTEKMRIASAGDVTVSTGNLVIGTSGKGIDFSATASGSGTMTSELLADYEEGTFTATLTPMVSGSITLNSSYNTLNYTKVGRVVYVDGYLEVSSVSSPVGGFYLNLPFAIKSGSGDAGSIVPRGTTGTNIGNFLIVLFGGESNARIYLGTGTDLQQAAQYVTTNTNFYISISYIV